MGKDRFVLLKKEWDMTKMNYAEEQLRFFIRWLIWPQYVWAEQEILDRKIKANKGD